MSTITKESIADTIEGLEHIANSGIQSVYIDIAIAGMRRLLASLEAEPVHQVLTGDAWVDLSKGAMDSQKRVGAIVRTVYTATPATVSVPDERYRHLSELYHAQEKRLFKIAQRIKGPSFDKYAYSPSQAIDALESAIFGEREDDCRAAMLQSFGNSEQLNSPVIPDGLRLALSNAGIAAPESDEMLAATCEKCIQELVTWVKERKPFRSAVIPDGWVACSERMPEQFVEVLACTEDGGRYVAALNQSMTWDDGDFFDDIQDVTHWQPLPSPPAK